MEMKKLLVLAFVLFLGMTGEALPTAVTYNGGLTGHLPMFMAFDNQSGNCVISATTHKCAYVFVVPKTGSITHIVFRTNTVTTPATIRVGIETIDTSGNPTTTQYGGSAVGTQASPATDTTYTVALGTAASATVGNTVAVVLQFNAGAGNLQLSGVYAGATSRYFLPFVNRFDGTVWRSITQDLIPRIGIKYSDGTYPYTGMFPFAFNRPVFNSGSTPDERALYFSVPFPTRMSGVKIWLRNTPGGDFGVVLYDGNGTTVLRTVNVSAAQLGSSTTDGFITFSINPVAIARNTTYRLAIKPTTVTNVETIEFDVPEVAALDALGLDQTAYYSQRTDAGSWSQTTTRRPGIDPIFDQFDDGTAVGGGTTSGGGGCSDFNGLLEIALGATNRFELCIGDSTQRGGMISGLTFTDVTVKFRCHDGTTYTIDEVGDTMVNIVSGYYLFTINDPLTASAEDQCLFWAEGTGIGIKPRPVKVIAATMGTLIDGAISNPKLTTDAITSDKVDAGLERRMGFWGTIVVAASPAPTTASLASASFSSVETEAYKGLMVECPTVDSIFRRVERFDPANDQAFFPIGLPWPSAPTVGSTCSVWIPKGNAP